MFELAAPHFNHCFGGVFSLAVVVRKRQFSRCGGDITRLLLMDGGVQVAIALFRSFCIASEE